MKISQEVREDTIIKDYSAVMESPPPGFIHDTSHLPHPKDQILKALLVGIGSGSDPEYVNALGVAAISLSNYQDSVGESIAAPTGGSANASSLEPDDIIKSVAGFDIERFQHFSALMIAEGAQTMKLIEGVKSLNPIFKADAPSKKKGWRRFFGL